MRSSCRPQPKPLASSLWKPWPAVAGDRGPGWGVVDTVVDGVNGLYFVPDAPAQMRPLGARPRAEPALRETLAANVLRHAESRSWRATMN